MLSILAALALVATACGSSSTSVNQGTKLTGVTVNLHYTVVGADDGDVAPDGNKHDTFKLIGDQPTIHVGDTVNVSVANYDDMPHGMTFDNGLVPSQVIAPKKDSDPEFTNTSYNFVATRVGDLRWHCPLPCDTDNAQWAMGLDQNPLGRDGFMAGTISVVA